MAEFSKLSITDKGIKLNAAIIAGTGNIRFSKIATSGKTCTAEDIRELDVFEDIKQVSLVSKVARINDVTVKVEAAFTNTELTEGYYIRTIGLYALDFDGNEILYAVASETSGNCYIPPYNGTTVSGIFVQLLIAAGSAENISMEVNPAAVATIGDLKAFQEQMELSLKKISADQIKELFAGMSDEFEEGLAYSSGEYTIRDNVLYKFIEDKGPGVWNDDKVQVVNLASELFLQQQIIEDLKKSVNAKNQWKYDSETNTLIFSTESGTGGNVGYDSETEMLIMGGGDTGSIAKQAAEIVENNIQEISGAEVTELFK